MVDQVVLSDSNRTPVVQILTWLSLVISVLAFLTHASIKLYIFRRLKIESWLVLCSLILCIAQSIAVTLQCQHGFGKPMSTLRNEDVQANLKSDYAATILFFWSLGCSKLAIVSFIHYLTVSETHRKINFGVGALAATWTLCSSIVAACQCRLPDPWNRARGHCIDRIFWWNVLSILNMTTDAAIVLLELGITAKLQTTRRRKAGIMSLFACRLVVVVAAAIQLMIFRKESSNATLKDDLTLGYWRSTICNQIVQCLAVLTTSLPYTKLFLEGFDTGFLGVNDLRRQGLHTSRNKSREYHLMEVSRSTPGQAINASKSWAIGTASAEAQYPKEHRISVVEPL